MIFLIIFLKIFYTPLRKDSESEDMLQLFERELCLSQRDIFFRKLSLDEKPLEMFVLWKLNGERKSLVLTDHDLNEEKYKKDSIEDMNKR